MKFLIIFFLLTTFCFAEEFTKDSFDAGELVKEIELATGLDLEGADQTGYMNTSKDKIEIKLKNGELTTVEKEKIISVINAHDKNAIEIAKKNSAIQIKSEIKAKLNLTDQDIEKLKDVLNGN